MFVALDLSRDRNISIFPRFGGQRKEMKRELLQRLALLFIRFFVYETLRCLSRNVIQRRRWSIMKVQPDIGLSGAGPIHERRERSAVVCDSRNARACYFPPNPDQLLELPWPGASSSSFVITFSRLCG